MFAAADVDPVIFCILAAVAFVLGVVLLVQSRLQSLVGWAIASVALAGVLAWWP
jgi:hypothetical protein